MGGENLIGIDRERAYYYKGIQARIEGRNERKRPIAGLFTQVKRYTGTSSHKYIKMRETIEVSPKDKILEPNTRMYDGGGKFEVIWVFAKEQGRSLRAST